jgi:hypothetical protein
LKVAKARFSQLKTEFVQCRILGHMWDEATGLIGKIDWGKTPGNKYAFRCERCSTERYEIWGAFGQLVVRWYEYDAGYALGKVELPGEMTMRQAMRVEKMGRDGGRG